MVYEKICPVRGKYTMMDCNELLSFFFNVKKKEFKYLQKLQKKTIVTAVTKLIL